MENAFGLDPLAEAGDEAGGRGRSPRGTGCGRAPGRRGTTAVIVDRRSGSFSIVHIRASASLMRSSKRISAMGPVLHPSPTGRAGVRGRPGRAGRPAEDPGGQPSRARAATYAEAAGRRASAGRGAAIRSERRWPIGDAEERRRGPLVEQRRPRVHEDRADQSGGHAHPSAGRQAARPDHAGARRSAPLRPASASASNGRHSSGRKGRSASARATSSGGPGSRPGARPSGPPDEGTDGVGRRRVAGGLCWR